MEHISSYQKLLMMVKIEIFRNICFIYEYIYINCTFVVLYSIYIFSKRY